MLFQHQRNRKLACIKAGRQIGMHDLIPVADFHIGQQTDIGNSCVVDEDIQCIDFGKAAFHKAVISDVTDKTLTGNGIGL